ncbi:MAG: BLUF domain-containing protein [Flavobacteriales bacterium]|nr:MAG: BLUF domain-containing protein [Flavobacteriales bacterium]
MPLKESELSLIHLIYVSTATEELDDVELDRIMDSSVRRNTAARITGMLLYAGGNFMQVLEGPEADVDATMLRIAADPRHHGLVVIDRCAIDQRSFGAWHMGYRRVCRLDMQSHPSLAPYLSNGIDADGIAARPGLAIEMLQEFAYGQRLLG